MKQAPKTKCDEVGFEHAWEDSNLIIPSNLNPVQVSVGRCKNCGLIRQKWRNEWWDYAEAIKREVKDDN